MEILLCSQCGSNSLNVLSDGNYQCIYCKAIMIASDKLVNNNDFTTHNTKHKDAPDLLKDRKEALRKKLNASINYTEEDLIKQKEDLMNRSQTKLDELKVMLSNETDKQNKKTIKDLIENWEKLISDIKK